MTRKLGGEGLVACGLCVIESYIIVLPEQQLEPRWQQ